MIVLSKGQKEKIVKSGFSKIGNKYPKGYKCHNFIREIYTEVGISTNFTDYPEFDSVFEIWDKKAFGLPLFLHRKETKSSRIITHIGIIFPNNEILHYSKWMEKEKTYSVFLSSFNKIFKIYDFVKTNFSKTEF